MKLLVPVKGSIQNPSFSPNGKAFLFNRFRIGYAIGAADIYIADLHDRERVTLVTKGDLEGATNVIAPGFRSTWTQNGWIYFATDVAGGGWHPARIRPNGERFERWPLPDGRAASGAPSASPSGEELAIAVLGDSNSEIFVAAVDNVQGGRTVGVGTNPSWSPDGQSLAWEVRGAADVRIAYHDIRSAETRLVTPEGQTFSQPTWHADSTKLLATGVNGLYEVTTMGRIQPAFAVEHPRTFWVGRGSWSPDFNGKRRRLLCEASDRDDPVDGPGTLLEIY